MLTISTSPHMSTPKTTQKIMLDVIIALTPAFIASVLFFGANALIVVLTSVAACVLTEYFVCKYLLKIKNTTTDLSAIVSGLLLAYNLPSGLPVPMVLVGSVVCILVAKMAYGGLGKNLFNPALVGRVFLFICFPLHMTTWLTPKFASFFNADAQTGATMLGLAKSAQAFSDTQTAATWQGDLAAQNFHIDSYLDLFLGNMGGCLGETSVLALLLGFAFLLFRKVISWHIPVFFVGTVFTIFGLVWLINGQADYYNPFFQIMSGGLMLGAIFMATDYVTSPMSKKGQIIFAIGCGFLTSVIRINGAYPEGVSFAILIMNAFVPLIDKYVRQPFFGSNK